MKRVLSKPQLILIFNFVFLIAHIFAETPQEVKNDFIAYRQRQREARLSARTIPTVQSRTVTGPKRSDDFYDHVDMYSSNNWAGALQQSPPSGTFNAVQAEWALPTVSRPPSASGAGEWSSTMWVGIDDALSCSAILQAGTYSYVQVDSSGAITSGAFVWYEWFPGPIEEIASFAVAAGETVGVIITATSSSQGTVVITNFNTGASNLVSISAPSSNNNLCGMTAEWILEDIVNSGGLVPFADFSPVDFQNCKASTTTGASVDLTGPDATLVEMTQNNVVVATPLLGSSSDLQITYA